MSNIVPLDIAIPAHLKDRVGNNAKTALSTAITGGISNGVNYPRISIKGSRFRIVEDGVEQVLDTITLPCVIVGANPRLSKTWYAQAWSADQDQNSAPDCYSLDGVRPASDVASPQNDLCASCPQNAWGSKVTQQGSKVKACADQKRLAIISTDDPTGPIYLLQVTPAALKGLGQYHKELSMRGIVPDIVKTVIGFDTSASFPKLKFSFGGFLDEPTQGIVDELFNTERVKEITGEAELEEAAPASAQPTSQKVVPLKVTKPTVVAVPDPEPEPEAQPTPAAPRRGFGAAAAPAAAPATTVKKATTPKAKPPVVAEPEAAAATAATDALADEIAGLIGAADDDAGA